MGFMDDINVLMGQGINVANKKTQAMRLQADLKDASKQKDAALLELGRAVYMREAANPAYADQIRNIANLESQESALRQQIDALQGGGGKSISSQTCPACSAPVSLDMPFCPSCGDNLASLKAGFRRCPDCGRYYTTDFSFCEFCGKATVALEVSKTVAPSGGTASGMGSTRSAANAVGICPHCKEPVKAGSAFCGKCGKRIHQ